jgi:hypothetical protein
LLLVTFALRAWRMDQPIVENYVGRQIPTAMVARNLERGGSFLRPEVDTGPFPNLFLVEPPIYAVSVVAFKRCTGLALEPAGRLVSALGIVLAGWGLFGLVRRREGPAIALAAVAALAVFPITIRYGRAFQPDALMLGTLVAALRCCDEREAGGQWGWQVLGWLGLAVGLALKITSAYVLIPLVLVIQQPPRKWKVALTALTLVPALAWYVHAGTLLRSSSGPSATAETAATWLSALVPTALLRPDTYTTAGWFLLVRAFTPLGFLLAAYGLARVGEAGRLWRVWGLAAAAALVVLAGKLHHEYYWLALAPVSAVGVGRAVVHLAWLGKPRRCAAAAAAIALVVLSLIQAASTWQTPPMWSSLLEAAAVVRAHVSSSELLIAPEALLYYADRRGFRIEYDSAAVARVARELGDRTILNLGRDAQALDLIALYQERGAHYFADVIGPFEGPKRKALHEAIREKVNSRLEVLVDRPDVVLIARSEVPVTRYVSPAPRHQHRGL